MIEPKKDCSYYYNYPYSKYTGIVPFNNYTDIATKEEIEFLQKYQELCLNSEFVAQLEAPFILDLILQDDFIFYYTQYTNYKQINIINQNQYDKEYLKFKNWFKNVLLNNFFCFYVFYFSQIDGNKPKIDALHSYLCALMQTHQLGWLAEPNGMLMINMPPRSGKSIIGNTLYCAWCIVRNPNRQILNSTLTADLSESRISQISKILLCKSFDCLERDTITITTRTKKLLKFNDKGRIRPVSIRSSITGADADLLMMDDMNNATDKDNSVLYDIAMQKVKYLLTRQRKTECALQGLSPVLIQQRTGMKDTTAMFLAQAKKDPTFKINHICYADFSADKRQLIVPRKEEYGGDIIYDIPAGYLEKLSEIELNARRALSDYEYQCQYQQKPESVNESHFNLSYLNYNDYDCIDIEAIVITTDFAYTDNIRSNYNCLCLWGIEYNNTGNKIANLYLLDIFYDKIKEHLINDVVKQFISNVFNTKWNFTQKPKKYLIFIETQNNEGRIYDIDIFLRQNLYPFEIIQLSRKSTITINNIKKQRTDKADRIKEAQGMLQFYNIFIRTSIDKEKPYILKEHNNLLTKAEYIKGIREEMENYFFSKGKNNTDDFLDNLSDILEISQALRENYICQMY